MKNSNFGINHHVKQTNFPWMPEFCQADSHRLGCCCLHAEGSQLFYVCTCIRNLSFLCLWHKQLHAHVDNSGQGVPRNIVHLLSQQSSCSTKFFGHALRYSDAQVCVKKDRHMGNVYIAALYSLGGQPLLCHFVVDQSGVVCWRACCRSARTRTLPELISPFWKIKDMYSNVCCCENGLRRHRKRTFILWFVTAFIYACCEMKQRVWLHFREMYVLLFITES